MKLLEINSNKLTNELIKEVFFSIEKEPYDNADYLVIYGCHIKEFLNERLNHALNIINTKKVGKVVLTGGVGLNGDFNESEYMKEYLIKNGVSKNKIIIEDKSTITLENDINVIKLLDLKNRNELTNIVFVTHEPHLIRIILHWESILHNDLVKLYCDYVDNTSFTYNNVINSPKLLGIMKEQIELIQEYIGDDILQDKNINYISQKIK